MPGQVYLYNPTITNLKLKINDPTVDDTDVRFLARTSREMGWIPQTSAEAVDRDVEPAPNRLGYGANILYIFRDMTQDLELADLEQPVPNWRLKRLRVKVKPEVSQLEEDLILYLLYDSADYGYILLDREGNKVHYQVPTAFVA